MKSTLCSLAIGFAFVVVLTAEAAQLEATEVLRLRSGTGPGAMSLFFDPALIERIAVDSQGRFLFLDYSDGPGAVSIYDRQGRFLQRIPVVGNQRRQRSAQAYRLFVDGDDNFYVEVNAYRRLQKFARDGRLIREFDTTWARPRYVDRRGHIYLVSATKSMIRELDLEGEILREAQAQHMLDIVVDIQGQIYFRRGPAPSGIPVAPELDPYEGDLFRDRDGNYYWNASEEGVCRDFHKNGPDRKPLETLTHVDLMRSVGYPYEAVVYLKGRGENKSSTTGGRFCTLGWYLSPQDEIYALVASDSLPKGKPWLRVLRVKAH